MGTWTKIVSVSAFLTRTPSWNTVMVILVSGFSAEGSEDGIASLHNLSKSACVSGESCLSLTDIEPMNSQWK